MIGIVVAAVALSLGLALGQRWFGAAPIAVGGVTNDWAAQSGMQTALMYPQPRTLPAFTLQRTDGRDFGNADLTGHWTLAFFGFTHCPDICPDTLARLQKVREQLVADGVAERVQMVFVTVDPSRDDAPTMQRYIDFFDPSVIGVRGDAPALAVLTNAIGIVHREVPLDGGGYTVDHSSQLVLFDPQGRQSGIIRPPFDTDAITADLITLTEQS